MRFVGLIFVIVVIGFLIGFITLNSGERVNIDIFGYRISDLSLSLVCFYSFAAGMIFVLIFALADEIVLRNTLHKMKKEAANLRKELDALRNLPFEEEK